MNSSTLMQVALGEFGVTEVRGKKHNPRIMQYAKQTGLDWVKSDETSWCSIFLTWVALKAQMSKPPKKVAATARKWLHVGEEVTTPQVGDVCVFWRVKKTSWQGHVGLFVRYSDDKKSIYVLGGNQSNKVSIATQPTSRLLGGRRLVPNAL